jgi:hypothetical protein
MSAMPGDTSAIRIYFAKLGLDPEIADLYLVLHAYGPQNISTLARNAGIERTRVYRLLDKLTSTNLVEVETHYKRIILRAAPIMNLQILLSQREHEIHSLQEGLHDIHNVIVNQSKRQHHTRVQFYQGIEGTKQMFWNESEAKGENVSMLFETMQTKTNLTFFERWVRKCNERELKFRGLISDHFLEDLQKWYKKHSNERLQNWEGRYVPPNIFPITHSCVTYDNVVSYYNWKDGEVFGIEIYNQEIADSQRRIFELIWEQAEPVGDDLKWRLDKIG